MNEATTTMMTPNSYSYKRGRGDGRRGGGSKNKKRLKTIRDMLRRILKILPRRVDVRRLSNEMHSRHGISHSAVDFVIDRVFNYPTTISKDNETGRCKCGKHKRGLCKKFVSGMLDATNLLLRVVERGKRIDQAMAFKGADNLAKRKYPRDDADRHTYALGGEMLIHHYLKLK